MSRRFVADKTRPEVKRFIDRKAEIENKAKEQSKFIEKIVENLKKEASVLWRELWDELQAAGLIEKNLDFDDFNMHLNAEHGQIFIDKSGNSNGLPGFLKHLVQSLED